MQPIICATEEEYNVLKRAQEEYASRRAEIDFMIQDMKSKKFDLGTPVIIGEGTVGIIVSYDYTNDYYRVYESERMNFIGWREENLALYTGELPEHLKHVEPSTTVKYLGFWINEEDALKSRAESC